MKLKYQIAALAASAFLAGCSEHDGTVGQGQSTTPAITNEPRESASALTNPNPPAYSQAAVPAPSTATNAPLATTATNAPLATTETNVPLASTTTNSGTADVR